MQKHWDNFVQGGSNIVSKIRREQSISALLHKFFAENSKTLENIRSWIQILCLNRLLEFFQILIPMIGCIGLDVERNENNTRPIHEQEQYGGELTRLEW